MANQAKAKRIEEPVEAGKSRVTQREFSRNPPTAEDEYFHEQEWSRLHPVNMEEPSVPKKPEPEVKGFWRRLFRTLGRSFNSDWQP
jgi:hypothetical protein